MTDAAGVENWADMEFLNERVFGSIDGRARSTSGSPIWLTAPNGSISQPMTPSPYAANNWQGRLARCTESSDPGEVEDCLAELSAHMEPHNSDSQALDALRLHVPRLLSHFKWFVRARAYKLLRRLPSPTFLAYCRTYIEFCVMHTLALDDGVQEEREQGLKFVRWTMRFDAGDWMLSPHVIKALMAVAEQADDGLRGICLETLCECLVRDPERLWYVGGLRTLTQAALDGPWAVSVAIASALAHLFDRTETRRFVHAGVTLGGIISALTEPAGKDPMLMERAKIAAFMLTQLLKSWGGLQYFLSDGRRGIGALVEALAMADANAKVLLGMLLELFGLSDDFDAVQFEQQPRFDVDLLAPFSLPSHALTHGAARTRLLPVDYMRTLLLTVFVDAGLVDALVSAALASSQAEVADASATLLKWLAQHPHMPLPESHVARFQTLGGLVGAALTDDSPKALAARRIVSRIEVIPSLSLGQMPSQQTDVWAASLASSFFYRHHLRQRRLHQQLNALESAPAAHAHSHAHALAASATTDEETAPAAFIPQQHLNIMALPRPSLQPGSASVIGGSKGLAAGLKGNAARVLRSSASTGNLRSAAAASTTSATLMSGAASATLAGPATAVNLAIPNTAVSLLGTVNEDSSASRFGHKYTASDASSIINFRGRHSLDISRSQFLPPQQHQNVAPPALRGPTPATNGIAQFISAISSPYVQVDSIGQTQTPGSIYSQYAGSFTTLSQGLDSPITPILTPVSAPAPPLLSRSRTKSRSRSRNSIVIVNNQGAEETPLTILIQESRVTSEDNPMRWDWDAIRTIILGHISQSRRLPEEVTVSGFIVRLSHFFHPASLEFCDLSRTTANEEYLEIGRQLIRILISSADGLLLIDESRLLLGIVEEIRKQNSHSRKKGRDESCFSFARLQMTMSPGYFHFLSEIDRTVGGETLLERNRLFDAYYQVVEMPDQVLLIQYILSSMSYAAPGHARNILRKVSSSPHEPLRMLVPSYLLYLTSDTSCRPGSVTAWAIDVLLSLLFDPLPAVRSAAAQCLVLAFDLPCENPHLGPAECDARIAYLLDVHPMFDLTVITDIRPLILRLIGTECGFAYLRGQGIVDSEMEAWGALEGIFYVQFVELDISRALAFGPLFSSTPDGSMMMTTSPQTPPTPPHLFGELAKNTGGRAFLEEVGIPRLLFETLANIQWNSELSADIVGLKATLWAIGAMGASRDGYLMLAPFDALGKLTEVARQANSMSIKGTCMYALALLSRSVFAAETFREKGWLMCTSCHGTYEYAVPRRLESIFNASDWAAGGMLDGTYVVSEGLVREHDVTDDVDSVQKEIIESIILMGNHVLVNKASKTLMRLRTSHPHYFRLLSLYNKAMHLLGKYRYRLSSRRFVYNIFDVNLAALHDEALAKITTESQAGERDGVPGGVSGRRFSSSVAATVVGESLSADSEALRKRASTLQECSSAFSTPQPTTMFSRRPTNGLLDDIRPAIRRTQAQQELQ
ncbi:Rapamycin-insensitive companion of mTOR, N-term-domain-containing protein [Kickxella alabastrina]|uniref:Rapamycin-insensitive companion of mTOR, N-term-domain-containing protein n=1 Tax=Kickxella alabastrina TaxID=61397 RepID=UPI00221E89B8|nr:Rapamycin-insensitive companion of mTOR, N-term-domain-containing protein [Kickxella alabastrina]KAI7824489.1 Rapamycin-insensitive companion of mTOR, N-term-domain-containing protein [Kickxella alabastrina]